MHTIILLKVLFINAIIGDTRLIKRTSRHRPPSLFHNTAQLWCDTSPMLNMTIITSWWGLITREIAHKKAKSRNIQDVIKPKMSSANYKIDIQQITDPYLSNILSCCTTMRLISKWNSSDENYQYCHSWINDPPSNSDFIIRTFTIQNGGHKEYGDGVSPIPSTTSFSCHVDLPIACWPPLYDGMCNNKRRRYMSPLRWGHNDHDSVSNHQPHGCLLVYSGAHQRKHQSSASLAFVRGIHRDRWIPRTKGQ